MLKSSEKADRTAEKLGEVGRHRGDFADDPHRQDDRSRELFAAYLGEVPTRHDAELGREGLKQHRDNIGEQHHPEEAVTVSRAGLNIRREIARIHIGDRRHDGGPGERQIAVPPQPLAVEDLTGRSYRSLGERCPSRPPNNARVRARTWSARDGSRKTIGPRHPGLD
jgi:hypothetical protein